jgi:hypothetical protein
MDTPRRIEHEQAEEDFKVEITDLGQVDRAETRLSSWYTRTLLSWQRPENRRHWRMVGISGIVLLSFLVVLLSPGPGLYSLIARSLHVGLVSQPGLASDAYSSSSATSPGPIIPHLDGLACLVDAAWSPNGNFIAVLGYIQGCPQNDFVPARVNIYDAHSSKLIAHWTPDYPVMRTLYGTAFFPARLRAITDRKPLPGTNGGFVSVAPIYYSHTLWSPDGQQLALTFTASTRLNSFGGILLIGSNGNQAQVFLERQNGTNPLYMKWNLGLGVPAKSTPAPPAIAYHWGPGGSLVPQTVLKDHTVAAAPAPGPVGNPDGGSSFTIWQPGLAIIISQAHTPSVYIWKTNVIAWSPDGNYLVEGIGLKAVIEPSGHPFPDPVILAALHLEHTPLLPVHDTALLRATFGSLAIAWRPDGRILAATNFTGSVDLFDCATGQKLGTLFTPMNRTPISGSPALLRWSPDGTRLLLSSAQWGIVNVWQLPQI